MNPGDFDQTDRDLVDKYMLQRAKKKPGKDSRSAAVPRSKANKQLSRYKVIRDEPSEMTIVKKKERMTLPKVQQKKKPKRTEEQKDRDIYVEALLSRHAEVRHVSTNELMSQKKYWFNSPHLHTDPEVKKEEKGLRISKKKSKRKGKINAEETKETAESEPKEEEPKTEEELKQEAEVKKKKKKSSPISFIKNITDFRYANL